MIKQVEPLDHQLIRLLIQRKAVGLKELYMSSNPMLYDCLLEIKVNSQINNTLLCNIFLDITDRAQDYTGSMHLFMNWINDLAQNAPRDVMYDYELFCNPVNGRLIRVILFKILHHNSEPPAEDAYKEKNQNHLLPLIYIKGLTRIAVAKKLNISIIEVRARTQQALEMIDKHQI